MMKIENLQVGNVYKNYKALCEVLEIPVKSGGDSKKAQIKELEHYVSFEKQGNGFLITEIKDVTESYEQSKIRDDVYNHLVQMLILDKLATTGSTFITTTNKMCEEFNVVNGNYRLGKMNKQYKSNELDINYDIVLDYYNTTNVRLNEMVKTALKNLENKRLLKHYNVTMVREGKTVREALPFEIKNLLVIEKTIMNEFGYSDIRDIRMSNKYLQFKKKLSNAVQEQTNFSYFYDGIKIIVNDEFIESEKINIENYVLCKIEKYNSINELNKKIRTNIINNAIKRSKTEYEVENRYNSVRKLESYVEDIKKLVEHTMAMNAIVTPIINKNIEIELEILASDLPF